MPLTSDSPWDVIVVGAGAAGMLAAIRSGQLGRRTLLLEKNRKPGAKILMSGGTRCNLTHATDAPGIAAAFGRQGRFLRSALYEFDPECVVRFFHDLGVPTKIESTGKVFPRSNRALDVQQALWREVQSRDVQAMLDQPVSRLEYHDGVWIVTARDQQWLGRKLIVTTGGCSYPGCGTRGDAYAWMAELGHTIVPPKPALVPLTTSASWIAELSGVTLEDTLVRVIPTDRLRPGADLGERLALIRKHSLAERRSALLFTHFGLSGPAAMDVSREFTGAAEPTAVRLIIDWLPDVPVDAFLAQLRDDASQQGVRSIGRWLSDRLPGRLAEMLLMRAGIDPQQRLAELDKRSRKELAEGVKSLEIAIEGTRGFTKAEVTAGGVELREVDSRSMASKIVDSLFVAGELLDVDGPIGGYNFQAAFSTGWAAGTAAS